MDKKEKFIYLSLFTISFAATPLVSQQFLSSTFNLPVFASDNTASMTTSTASQTGTWGTASWSFDASTGALTIANGTLTDVRSSPWWKGVIPAQSITSITFTGSVAFPPLSQQLFYGLTNLTTISGGSNVDTSSVATMKAMFYKDTSLQSIDVSSWDTSSVSNMVGMFVDDRSLTTLAVGNWNTSNVIDMSNMFAGAAGLTTIDVSNWNTSSVTSMAKMFLNDTSLTTLDVSNWDTSNVTNMTEMFDYAEQLAGLDVSKWNTSSVTNMAKMFYVSTSLSTLDVSNWNTSKVTDMSYMFSYDLNLTALNPIKWDTSSVTNMTNMFSFDQQLQTLDVSQWNTSQVTDMSWMFTKTHLINSLNLSNWDVSHVTNMAYMFWEYGGSTLDISNEFAKTTYNVTDMTYLFDGLVNWVKKDSSGNLLKFGTNQIYGLSGLRTDSVTSMSHLFNGSMFLQNIDVSNFITKNVTNFSYMFSFTISNHVLNLSNFDTAAATTMQDMLADITFGKEDDGTLRGLDTLVLGNKVILDNTVGLVDPTVGNILPSNRKIVTKNNWLNLDNHAQIQSSNLMDQSSHPGTWQWDTLTPTVTTESKTVNETVNYQYADGTKAAEPYTKAVTFTRSISTDPFTGAKTDSPWSTDQTFPAVKSPSIKGYTADKVQIDSQTVNGDSQDVTETVIYRKNAPTVTTESKTVNERVNYQYADGTKAAEPYSKAVTFTRTVSTDAVTGDKTDGPWSANQTLPAVQSPSIKGYTADKVQIDSQTVNGDSQDVTETVIYNKNAPIVTTESKTVNERVNYQYADGTKAAEPYTKAVTFTRTVSTDAVTGAKTDGPWSADQTLPAVKSPSIKGYTADKITIDQQRVNGDSPNLVYTVTYNKNQPGIRTESKTVNERVNYQYADGTKAAEPYTKAVTFTRSISTDPFTGAKTDGPWSTDQTFPAVQSPSIKGYTADKVQIDSQIVNGDSQDVMETVIYRKNAPTVTTESKTVNERVNYQYADGTKAAEPYTKAVIFTRTVSTDAVTGAKTDSPWSTDQTFPAVQSPSIKGYTADKITIDQQRVNGDSPDLVYTVTYNKNQPGIRTESKTVNETVNYQYDDGTKAAEPYTKGVTFTRTISTDAVTGVPTYGAWSASQVLPAIIVPQIKGYTADRTMIDQQSVNGDSPDLSYTVIYNKNAPIVTTESKTVNERIDYQFTDGRKAADTYTKAVTFTRAVLTDAVTGVPTYGAWSPAQTLPAVKSPIISGYQPNQREISSQVIDGESSDFFQRVTYSKIIPVNPRTNYPVQENHQTGLVASKEIFKEPLQKTTSQQNMVLGSNRQRTLPDTDKKNVLDWFNWQGQVGLLTLLVAGFFALALKNKKKDQ